MAIINCRECDTRISTDAKKCPQCGANDPSITHEQLKQGSKIAIAILLICLTIFGYFIITYLQYSNAQNELKLLKNAATKELILIFRQQDSQVGSALSDIRVTVRPSDNYANVDIVTAHPFTLKSRTSLEEITELTDAWDSFFCSKKVEIISLRHEISKIKVYEWDGYKSVWLLECKFPRRE